MKTFALALALTLVPVVGSAQTPPSPRSARRVYRAGAEILVPGTVAHPYFWVHTRGATHYRPAEPRRAFAPAVVRAVRQAPF